MTAKEMTDAEFINFQDDFYNLLEKYGVSKIDIDRKSTRLNSSHGYISYAVFCLKKKSMKRKTS